MAAQCHLQGILCEGADVDVSRLFWIQSIAIILEQQPVLAIVVCEDKGVDAATEGSLHPGVLLWRNGGQVEWETGGKDQDGGQEDRAGRREGYRPCS